MMKKLLTLFLVLAMVSGASAASTVVITVNGQEYTGQDVMASDMIQISLVDAVSTQLQNVNAGTAISVDQADNWSHTWAPTPVFQGSVFDPVGAGYEWAGYVGYMMAPMPVDDTVFVHEFHVPNGTPFSTDITIGWAINYAGDQAAYNGGEVLHVVPEPMTLGLLGLGGLFLRRRKK